MLSTPLTKLLGIEHPIIQAGMASEAGPALAAAVSNAGGLGSIGTIGLSPSAVHAVIAELRTLTDRPFSVNVITFDWAPFAKEILEAAIEERVPSITLSFGDPTAALARCREAGIPAIVQVQDFATAKRVLEGSPAAVITQGSEGGGHTGQRGTLSFGAQVLEAAGGVPVVLAGGVGNGRGLAAALGMGASGVVMGTRFKASEEFAGSPAQKEAIRTSDGSNTLQDDVFDAPYPINWPSGVVGRALRNRYSDQYQGRVAEVRERAAAGATPFAFVMELSADPETQINWAGQASGLIDEVLPAAEIVARTVQQAEALLRNASAVVV
jgi:nitronate monooxygenase